ncbi:MAG: hypothetical protein U5L72_08905 [Bacteroidales bacterium]|nr:hypothetical protein [Bacteroidales bacterium]
MRPDENLHHPLCRADLMYPPKKIMRILEISRLLEAVHPEAYRVAISQKTIRQAILP